MSSSKRYKWEFKYRPSFTKITVLCTKKELLVLEYINKGYVVTYRQESVPICLRNRPCAGTVLPHTIDKLIALIRLRSTDQMIVPVCLRSTDRLIDKLYAWPLSLPPLVPYYYPNRLLLLPPAAKPTPCCLPAALQLTSTAPLAVIQSTTAAPPAAPLLPRAAFHL